MVGLVPPAGQLAKERPGPLDVRLCVPDGVVANSVRTGRPDALVPQVAPERPERVALGGGQLSDRRAGLTLSTSWVAVLDLGVVGLGCWGMAMTPTSCTAQ
jgi:hypothetical protein